VRRDTGLFLILGYKLLRGTLALGAAAVLLGFGWSGRAAVLHAWADGLRHHFTSHWSSALAESFAGAVTRRNLVLAATALTLDGIVVLVEGWALWRGKRWGEWLVALSTAALVPFEAVEIWHHPRFGPVALLLGNLAVVLYLLQRVVRARAVNT